MSDIKDGEILAHNCPGKFLRDNCKSTISRVNSRIYKLTGRNAITTEFNWGFPISDGSFYGPRTMHAHRNELFVFWSREKLRFRDGLQNFSEGNVLH